MEQVGPANYTQFQLVQTKAVFPLGWLLRRTRNLMDQQMGPNSAENGPNVRPSPPCSSNPSDATTCRTAAKGERAPEVPGLTWSAEATRGRLKTQSLPARGGWGRGRVRVAKSVAPK
jgi:hypothetical protein